MQNAWDYGGGLVEEGEVGFKEGEVRGWCGGGSPEKRVVVGEEGKENSEEEGCGCLGAGRVLVRGLRGRGWGRAVLLRQRIMKVAKDWERFPIAMLGRLVSVVRLRLRGFAAGVYPQASKARYVCGGEKFNYVLVKLYLT